MHADHESALNRHYAHGNLQQRIVQALEDAGMTSGRLTVDDLAPLDQFHTRGKLATRELAQLARLQPAMAVLDVGGGLGGAARTLASEFGCRVTVLDLTEAYCRVGEMLTARAGLEGRVEFQTGNALLSPFPDAAFDVVWMQHVNMNIEDKDRLYGEAFRLLLPGGQLAIHEIVAGARAPVHFPVPWAADASLSFLRPARDLRGVIEARGFSAVAFKDGTDSAIAWFRERLKPDAELPPLGLHLLLGSGLRAALENLLKNLEEQRVGVIAAVYRK